LSNNAVIPKVYIAVNDCKYVAVVDLFRRVTEESSARSKSTTVKKWFPNVPDGSNTDAYGLKPGTAAD
jgi:hypothetical protein